MSAKRYIVLYWIVGALLIAALALTYVSALKLCTIQCAAHTNYTLFGSSFEPWGYLLFSSALFSHIAAYRYPRWHWFTLWLLSGAAGAEVWLIYLQKYTIGQWCPLCLGIALCVFLALAGVAILLFLIRKQDQKSEKNKGGFSMRAFFGSFISLTAITVGFFSAFVGINQFNPLDAAQQALQDQLVLGKSDGAATIYFFSDWRCPSCRKVEPLIEKITPDLMQKNQVVFVDVPIHFETANFTPYNLTFLVRYKDQYLPLRRILTTISTTTGSPSEKQVTKAIAPLVSKYEPLNYADIALGSQYYKKLAKDLNVTSTPTVVIVDKKTNTAKKLKGSLEISEKNIRQALDKVTP
jgi:thiol-disulfide isomerase/thioredoxin